MNDNLVNASFSDSIPELHSFQNALLFCNAIVQVAHSEVVHMLVIYFFGGFLNVFKSSVLEVSTRVSVSAFDGKTNP